ncbi:DUF2489 domain-containing protein [Burkholderia ambifaria]|uniref:DUF2489 domain-containing protein n=1 Tax=Burkholderia ambifaria TaxID=152480 RepID=UPI00158A2EAC|nr:DUF2489 domain-containing protein [Burkholderia ambifaria]WAS57124.1 DUF2489 domain-containing protein [Burkholderia ambifaria]WDR87689.1 DUF2489 domain-containing protein [Burkholderia ambifaria]WDS00405.1 DUF2489 domain-containing protein [Burkholderia ambifaria]
MNENEAASCGQLVSIAQAMLDGKLTFLEGAAQVLAIKSQLTGVADRDPDFDAFVVIQSETDHLPLEAQRSLWSPTALAALEPEFRQVEEWAKSFAPQACRNLIERFDCSW